MNGTEPESNGSIWAISLLSLLLRQESSRCWFVLKPKLLQGVFNGFGVRQAEISSYKVDLFYAGGIL